ncbi:MAG: GNAT family N-acetyltransferase, partial [Bacteroidota bacterium]
MIRSLKHQDCNIWLELAKEVEFLFGPMADLKEFQNGIIQCIQNNSAFGIENKKGNLAGIIAIDREKNEILWLAVSKKYRGNSYGDKLVKKAIEELECNGSIFVQTFSEKENEGKSARFVYEKNGFVYFKDAGKNPANIDTIIMVRN